MTATQPLAEFRIRFTQFIPDPVDPDCQRRALVIPADLLTFDDAHAVFWLAGTEVARYPLDLIADVTAAQEPSAYHQRQEELRSRYPKHGTPWTNEDDHNLTKLYEEGSHSIADIATVFDRRPSAIESRLTKLGLITED